ncbi:hypothetical protein GCM10010191_35640 [Actinomadura vinacea]|uniref:DUF3592 domain-containing protein n=1 Tax=Actinomadura vinacea TaxID=115336 RepID=A0ABP5W6J5_9ACTN
MIGNILAIAVGLAFIVGGLRELAGRIRMQRRMRRAPGVFVGRAEVGHMSGPGVRSRAGRFRFTTEAGQVVERMSALSSFPGPKPGRSLTVVYDPARPGSTAERAWVHLALLLVFSPVAIALGTFIVIRSLGAL